MTTGLGGDGVGVGVWLGGLREIVGVGRAWAAVCGVDPGVA